MDIYRRLHIFAENAKKKLYKKTNNMEEEKVKTAQRYRRTRASLEQDIVTAAESLIAEKGFSKLKLTDLCERAKIESPVFYNRYRDMDDFIEKFVRDYDYWLSDNVHLDEKNMSPVENMNNIIQTLIDSLAANPVMQKLIAWELNENNYVTRRTAQNRDNNSQEVIHYFENQLKANEINFNVGSAIVIGGVYYLIMHKDLATFNNVDFSTEEGMQMLKETVTKIVYKLFGSARGRAASTTEKLTSQRIARNLLQSGVDRDTILKATGLSEEELNALNSPEEEAE